jgi:dihydrofolate reductase
MGRIVLIAAMDRNRGIGHDNSLPWRLPDDLKHFKALTLGKTIVMGRKTFESLPGILPDRRHIVITTNQSYRPEKADVVHSLDEAVNAVSDDEDVLVVGGAEIYRQFLPAADMMYLTLVDTEVEADAFFPVWNDAEWREVSRTRHEADERHRFAFDFVTFQRVLD